ncbi:MAG: lysine--tRNA ligase, partial [Candidatus Limnocylindrus sp.]
MYWADELAARVSGPQVVNDSKTPSGTVHVGSLRGPVMHDAIARALRDRGIPVQFRYGVEDMDAMDAQALLTPDAVERYMGVPLSRVPAPEGSTAENYARHFVGTLFFPTFARLGIRPEFYWLS